MAKFDLSKEIENAFGNPILDGGTPLGFKQPQEVQVVNSGEKIEGVTHLIKNSEHLTYRKAIQQALLADVPQQNNEMPDKHKRSMLALKLIADKDVEFTSDEITLIKNSAKHAPQTQTVVYMRIVELLDPVEAGVKEK